MKKLHVLALALVAVFAFGAIAAAMASAETLLAEWLVNGAPIPAGTTVPTQTFLEILLEDNKTFLGAVAALCSLILDGWVGPDGEDLVTEILDLAGKLIEPLIGAGLTCTNEHNCENPKSWPDKLPWPTLLVLVEPGGKFSDEITGSAYESTCTLFGSTIEDLCEAPTTSLPVENDVAGFVLTPTESIATPNANCSQGGAGGGVNETEGDSTIKTVSGVTLQVSE